MLAHAVESYLAVRRACGFTLEPIGKRLRSFATFSDARSKPYVCSETALEWAGLARSVAQRARRLGDVIRFARSVRAEDPRHELPPAVFGSENRSRPVPYIFSRHDIERLVQALSQSGQRSLRRSTYSTLFALLACLPSSPLAWRAPARRRRARNRRASRTRRSPRRESDRCSFAYLLCSQPREAQDALAEDLGGQLNEDRRIADLHLDELAGIVGIVGDLQQRPRL